VIDSLAIHLEPFLAWLLRTTWQASLLIGLILLIQKVAGRRLGVRGRYCLWLLVLARLAMPGAVQSGLSMYNLLPLPSWQGYEVSAALDKVGLVFGQRDRISAVEPLLQAGAAVNGTSGTSSAPRTQRVNRARLEARIVVLLSLVWLGGVCSLAGCIVVSNLRLRRIVRRGRIVTDRWILGLLEDCRQLISTRAGVGLIATDGIDSPALCGLLRPRLLLPRDTLARRDRTELRHIFLHELAHLKRHDLLVGHVASLLHVFHWFNPVIEIGFRRMRADRELACDGLALSLLHPDEARAYGRTLVRQIEQLLTARPRWMLAGLGGDRAQIKRRIAMIAASGPYQTYHRSPLAMALVGVLACAGLTDGLAAGGTWDDLARRDLPTTHQDQHAFIERLYIRNRETGEYLVVKGDEVVCEATRPGLAGLWEVRFDINLGHGDPVFFYSAAANKYLTSDDHGNLAVDRADPDDDARWIVWARPQGAWVISEKFKDGYLRQDEQGRVRAVVFGRDTRSYWDVDGLWRVKTSDHPEGTAEWHRQHVPGPN
jgi:beta-lactamase regulating signal transducer with metallopeptidase domain